MFKTKQMYYIKSIKDEEKIKEMCRYLEEHGFAIDVDDDPKERAVWVHGLYKIPYRLETVVEKLED